MTPMRTYLRWIRDEYKKYTDAKPGKPTLMDLHVMLGWRTFRGPQARALLAGATRDVRVATVDQQAHALGYRAVLGWTTASGEARNWPELDLRGQVRELIRALVETAGSWRAADAWLGLDARAALTQPAITLCGVTALSQRVGWTICLVFNKEA